MKQLYMVEVATGRIVGEVMSSHPETFPCKPAYEMKTAQELTVEQLQAYESSEKRS
jgi:hypothetical protein